jgi:YbbR domain-containing protein
VRTNDACRLSGKLSLSLTNHYNNSKQVLTQQKVAFVHRMRRNFFLKWLSLCTAVLLYFYVQQERNPTITRQFLVPVIFEGQSADISVETDQPQFKVAVTGPQPVLELMKDSDIRIVGDLRNVPTDTINSQKVRLHYDVRLSHEMQLLLSYDPWPLPRLDVQVYPQRSKDLAVDAHYPQEPRVGYHYGPASIRPARVHVTGRIDRVKRVTQIVADASSLEHGGGIDNEFPLSARDANNNPVEGITLDVTRAHVTVPILEDPYSRILSISPIFNDQPPPGFRIAHVTAEPNQVKATGRPEIIDTLSTVSTEEIDVHEMTGSQVLLVPLVMPRGVTLKDAAGNPVTRVTVHITVEKQGGTVPSNPGQSGSQQQ